MSYEDKMNPTPEWPGFYYSAYGIAVKHGFKGSEEDWLHSLAIELDYDKLTQEQQEAIGSLYATAAAASAAEAEGYATTAENASTAAGNAKEDAEDAQEAAESARDAAVAAKEDAEDARDDLERDLSAAVMWNGPSITDPELLPDANDAVVNRIYVIASADVAEGIAHLPTNKDGAKKAGMLLCLTGVASYSARIQLYLSRENLLYTRFGYTSGDVVVWMDWEEIVTADELAALAATVSGQGDDISALETLTAKGVYAYGSNIDTAAKAEAAFPSASGGLNAAAVNTIYSFGAAAAIKACDNRPGDRPGVLVTMSGNTTGQARMQLYIDRDGKYYWRALFSNAWTSWTQGASADTVTALDSRVTALESGDTYYVGPTREYTSFTDLLLDLKSGWASLNTRDAVAAYKGPTIYLDEGVYDVYAEYRAAVAAGTLDAPPDGTKTDNYYGYCAFLPPNTHMIGVGDVTLLWAPETTGGNAITATESKIWSPLNVLAGCCVENITIDCRNGRYCIHDDPQARTQFHGFDHVYKNVRCIKRVPMSGYGLNNTIGFGFTERSGYEFDGCYFENEYGHRTSEDGRVFYGHDGSGNTTNAGTYSGAHITVRNCTIIGGIGNRRTIRLQTMGNDDIGVQQRIVTQFSDCFCDGALELSGANSETTYKQNFDVLFLNSGAPDVYEKNIADNPYPVRVYDGTSSAMVMLEETGDPLVIEDSAGTFPPESVVVHIQAEQSGSGDPTPSNVRAVSGYTGADVTVNNREISVAWSDKAGTVYGGMLNVTTGQLTVMHELITFETLGTPTYSGGVFRFTIPTGEDKSLNRFLVPVPSGSVIDGLCEIYKPVARDSGNVPDYSFAMSTSGTTIFVADSRYTSVNDFKAAVKDVQILLPLKESAQSVYRLPAEKVWLLAGENTISADCGPVTMRYRADPTAIYEKLTAAIISLGGNI